MDLDPQSIEKRDFPIARRGYDPAAVDAHLRAIAAEVEELRRQADGAAASLGATAGTQVQGILEAAEATAADLVRQAEASAARTREAAEGEAASTREEAITRAQAHVAAVQQTTSALLSSVESAACEVDTLLQNVRAAAAALSSNLSAMHANMAELHDTGSAPAVAHAAPAAQAPAAAQAPSEPSPPVAQPAPASSAQASAVAQAPPVPEPPAAPAPERAGTAANGDLDSARLVALNMALNGDSREQTDRYLAEHFSLADRQKLLDEVYAAIEG